MNISHESTLTGDFPTCTIILKKQHKLLLIEIHEPGDVYWENVAVCSESHANTCSQ